MATDPIEAGLELSERLLSSIDTLIKSQILASFLDVIPGVDAVVRQIDNLVVTSETAIHNAEQSIKTQIEPLIKNAIPDALTFLGSIASSLDAHLGQLIG